MRQRKQKNSIGFCFLGKWSGSLKTFPWFFFPLSIFENPWFGVRSLETNPPPHFAHSLTTALSHTGSTCLRSSNFPQQLPEVYLPLTPRCPFMRRPTEGDTSVSGRSGRREGRFSGRDGSALSTVSDHTASTMESMLAERGSLLLIVPLLKRKMHR